MAQIIKHRRGSVSALKDVTANIGELVMATGSIGDFNGPIVFVGDAAVAGGYKPVSKIYQGSVAPTISVGSHGSTMDGIPFFSTNDQTLYILDKSGNSAIDLTGNIEGNLISGVTINNLTGTTATITNISGSTITGTTISGSDARLSSNLNVTGDISGSNMYLTGDAIIDGNITLGGNITIGDQTTDIIQFGGEVSSSIVPKVHNAFDLGTSELNWRNLHVSGTAYIDILEAQQVNFNDLGILTDLTVSGSTYLGNGGDITVVSGSLYNDQLTENRIVIVGANGLLEDSVNLTFDGVTINAGTGNIELNTVTGDIRTSGSLLVTSGATVTGSINVSNDAIVTGSLTALNSVYTDNIYGKTNDTNSLHLNGGERGAPHVELESVGQISLFSEGAGSNYAINMTGSVNMADNLGVTGSATFKDNVDIVGVLTVTGNTQLQSNLYVSGNLEVLGSSTNVNIQSQTVEIDDNIIRMNAYSPFLRYAGIEVIDSGSSGISASMLWDSENDYWMFVSGSGESSKFIGTTYGAYGSEVSLTNTYFPIATGANTIGDSLLRYSGTTLSFNTNKFTIDSDNGDTAISGNVTLSYSGGTDAGTLTSTVVFRNSSNVLGYVGSSDMLSVTTQLLGYNTVSGNLEFSSIVDGGTY